MTGCWHSVATALSSAAFQLLCLREVLGAGLDMLSATGLSLDGV